jgi:hypothetical protein
MSESVTDPFGAAGGDGIGACALAAAAIVNTNTLGMKVFNNVIAFIRSA